ncbi:MAG TPA: 16S rRNA (guanine(527)-N(7))-methyltransferase RsmG [Caulobacteraceae bacterium]|nr:16S rRNA (guanine(527)-N(7))-methyltransferase RsmG [Caulobacteraceae bacterium]
MFGPEDFAEKTGVSQETLARLKAYAGLLEDWNARHNLVARSTLPDLWRRHFWDSAQLEPLIPAGTRTLADLGSGAGFPGLVLAAMRPEIAVTLHESIGKKCAFLTAAAERMGLAVTVQNARIETLPTRTYDVITARALAPLPLLLSYAQRLTGPNSVCLFLKGQNVGSELTEAHKSWKMETSQVPSQTDPSGAILVVRKLVCLHEHPSPQAPRPGRRQPERRRR